MKFCVRLIIIILFTSCQPQMTIEKMVTLDYSSGSGSAVLNKQIYLVGDDMNYLLVLDSNFAVTDSIFLKDTSVARVSKADKQDLEAAALMKYNGLPVLFFTGSGSVDSTRNGGWAVYPFKKEKIAISLDTFYRRLKTAGLTELNIEGMAALTSGFIISNRGNKGFPKNHLVFTGADFWMKQKEAAFRLVKIGSGDTASFHGVSGMDHSKKSDNLYLSVSTENTYDNVSDGAIGKSYLWIVHNISGKRRMAAINPSRIIDLADMDERFAGHKMESVSILSETKKDLVLIMVSDNDDGKTTLFRVRLKK